MDSIDNLKLLDFYKIIKDLLIDLNNTFSDKVEPIISNNRDFGIILNYERGENGDENEEDNTLEKRELLNSANNIFHYCKKVFPERFFDILYQNEEIFSNETNTEFLPGLNFSDLYFDTTSIQTKETLWKYLQLILFSIITTIDNKDSFGNSAQLFEAINNEEFKNKLQDTVNQMENLFNFKTQNTNDNANDNEVNDNADNNSDISLNIPFNFEKIFESMNNMNVDGSSNQFNNLPNSESIHDHISNIMNGKIGSLAKELAEETAQDLDIDVENVSDINGVFKQLFKNPTKLMGLVNNISTKLDSKMKDGSIKESELLEEAGSLFKNMNSMPGMENFSSLFKSMNMDQFLPKGGKFNNNAFQHMMDQNIKTSKMKERMRKKAEQNKEAKNQDAKNQDAKNQDPQYSQNYNESKSDNQNQSNINTDTNNLNDINSNLASLMAQMQNMQSEGNEGSSNEQNRKRRSNNKKKANRKR